MICPGAELGLEPVLPLPKLQLRNCGLATSEGSEGLEDFMAVVVVTADPSGADPCIHPGN